MVEDEKSRMQLKYRQLSSKLFTPCFRGIKCEQNNKGAETFSTTIKVLDSLELEIILNKE